MTDVSPSVGARMSDMASEILTLRARLAKVLALCERNFNMEDWYEIDANDVAAILEGEGDRG